MTNRVKIKITGKNPSTFLKELIAKKINIYELEKRQKSILIIITIKDYKKIIETKTTYHIEVIKYYGLCKIKQLIKKYLFLIIVWIIGIGINYFLSTRIWKIEIINPNQKIVKIVKQDLKKMGIATFQKKRSYQLKEDIKKKILEKEKNHIEWIEIEEKGSKYIIKVEERKKNKEDSPCLPRNIVSKKKAIITNIQAEEGEILVKKNDYVEKGQILISGWIHNKEEAVSKKCAIGKVLGETWYRVTIIVPTEKEKQYLTGRKKKTISLKIGNKEYHQFQKYSTYVKKEYNIIEEEIIPLRFSFINYLESKTIRKKYSIDQINHIALKEAEKVIKGKLSGEEEILEKKVLKKTPINSKIKVDVFLKVKENITDYEDISKIEKEKRDEVEE